MSVLKNHPSIWLETTPTTNFISLEGEVNADVVVVGGGLAGLITAYLSCKRGKKVIVLEMNRIAADVTGHTTAKITAIHGLIYQKIKHKFGLDAVGTYLQSNLAGLEKFFEITKEEKIDCDLSKTDSYVYTSQEKKIPKLKKELELLKEFGLDVSYEDNIEIPGAIGAIKLVDQAQFHPRKFLLGLAKVIIGHGSKIFEETAAIDIQENSEGVTVICDKGKVTAKNAVVATNFPFYDKGFFFARLYPYRSYALALEKEDKKGLSGMYYSIDGEEYSFRDFPNSKGKLIILGGGNHKAGQAEDTRSYYADLEKHAKSIYPNCDIAASWSTQDNSTPDNVPYIGFVPGSKYILMATGFGGWGMTNSAMSAILLDDLMNSGSSMWESLYSPSRKDFVKSVPVAFKENANVAKEFVEKNNGKDEDSEQKISLKCTHMGCTVRRNMAENTWDCPCHGSRFFIDGEVMHGPAVKPLQKLDD